MSHSLNLPDGKTVKFEIWYASYRSDQDMDSCVLDFLSDP